MSTPLTDRINALTAYSNNKTGASDATLSDAVTRLVEGYGGGSIGDGIIVKSRDSDGYITEFDLYSSTGIIGNNQFRSGNNNNAVHPSGFYKTEKINSMNPIISVGEYAFAWNTSLRDFDMSKITTVGQYAFSGCGFSGQLVMPSLSSLSNARGCFLKCSNITGFSAPNLETSENNALYSFFSNCASLENVYLPKATLFGTNNILIFEKCTALATCQLGSVGYGVTKLVRDAFSGCTQNSLTITVYTTGSYVNSFVGNIRTTATNATIIFKASEATTYNDTSYAAGDTILTSTPNS